MPHVGRMWGKGGRNKGRGQRITEVGEKMIRCSQSMVLNTKKYFTLLHKKAREKIGGPPF